jgi:antitoxin (DNA-binding transcriptional repressor) of toxin-antitoxin stability system
MVMKAVRIAELKAHLSEHLRAVRRGEILTVLDRDTPIARISPVGGEVPLLVRPARGSLADLVLPSAARIPAKVVAAALAEERQASR